MRKRIKFPLWLVCVIFVAFTLLLNLRFWTPITEESGEHMTLTLESASVAGNTLYLDFGRTDSFHMVYSPAFDALLTDEALGKEYELLADYRPQRRNRDYYDVYALSCTDGTVYLTLEQSEAIRQAMLPKRLGLMLVLDAAACGLIIWKQRKRPSASAQPEHDKEESP